MNWLIFVLALIILVLLVICYALLVMVYDAEEEAERARRAWKENGK